MKDIVFVIPARLESTRLKHKMLMMFDDEPLIRIVFDKVRTMGYDTFVITDSPKIAEVIPSNNVIMTNEAENGTARIAQAHEFLNQYQTIINIQGDMIDITHKTVKPFIDRAKNNFVVYTAYTKYMSQTALRLYIKQVKLCGSLDLTSVMVIDTLVYICIDHTLYSVMIY